MKKLLLSSALVAITSTAAVADGSGFFVGLYGGYMGSSSSTNVVAFTALAGANPVSLGRNDLGGNGGQGGLMLGYNYAMENGAVVGLDLFGQFGSHSSEDTVLGRTLRSVKLDSKYAFGAAARFGYMFDTTHAYLRVGYINSRFELTQVVNRIAPNTSRDASNVSGLLLGLGADMPVGEMITVGFNYDFSIYQSKSALDTAGNPNPNHRIDYRPRTHAVNFVIKYAF